VYLAMQGLSWVKALLGCDPGATWALTRVSGRDRGPGSQDVTQLTTPQYYQLAGITSRKHSMRRKLRHAPGFEAWQSQIPTSSTGSEQGLLRWAKYLMAALQRTLGALRPALAAHAALKEHH
jgi:hypothetical protein